MDTIGGRSCRIGWPSDCFHERQTSFRLSFRLEPRACHFHGRDNATLQLFEDTGWWRGSALYRDSKGEYLLDDGMDYVSFTFCPPKFTMKWQMSTGERFPQETAPAESPCNVAPLEADVPLSVYETKDGERYFLGMFIETHPGLAFKTWREVDEPTPDSINAGG